MFYLNEKNQALTDLIDGTIGELSMFQDTYGIYAHGVRKETAVLPPGWEERLVKLSSSNTSGYTGLCLDPYDLCISKLIAFREKDIDYVKSLLNSELIYLNELKKRLLTLEGHDEQKNNALTVLKEYL